MIVRPTIALREELHAVPLDVGALALHRVRGPEATRAPVLLVHGFGMNGKMWHLSRRSFAAYLARQGYDVFILDLRGVGQSRRFASAVAEHPDDHIVEDLPRALDAALRLSDHSRAFVIGHSLGGLLSYCAMPLLADRLRGLVTMSGVFTFASHSRFLKLVCALERRLPASLRAEQALPVQHIARLLWLGRSLADSPLAWKLMPIHAWSPGTIERDVLREHAKTGWDFSSLGVLRSLLETGAQGVFRSRTGVAYHGDWHAVDLPLLVVSAEQDTLLAPVDASRAFERSQSRDKRFVLFGSSQGHGPYGHLDLVIGRDAPADVWPTVSRWLDARAQV